MLFPGSCSISGFESDCTDLNIRVYLADTSEDAPALEPPLFEFSKKFLGGDAKGDFITPDQGVEESLKSTRCDLIIQLNIEGFEYEILDFASKELVNRFRIIVIEFHGLYLFERLKKGFSENCYPHMFVFTFIPIILGLCRKNGSGGAATYGIHFL